MSSDLSELLEGKRFVLASRSPRRARILRKSNIEFEIIFPEDIAEENISVDPVSHVLELSQKKAENVAEKAEGSLVMGADTIVVLDGEILGKPTDTKDAFRMLKKLSGKKHRVYTGITILDGKAGKILSDYQLTEVKFNQLKDEEIEKYVKTGEPLDKAGGYGIQGMGSFLVEKIKGDLDNVIGLPLRTLKKLLNKLNSGNEG